MKHRLGIGIVGVAAIIAIGIAVSIVAGAGETPSADVRPPGLTSADVRPRAQSPLVSAADRAKLPPGSPERVFLDYYASLQFADWPFAVSAFDARYLAFIGIARTTAALRSAEATYATSRPRIDDLVKSRGRVSVRYFVRIPGRGPSRQTAVLVRRAGAWRIIYDSSQDQRLASAEQVSVQSQFNPTATKPSRRALRAGTAAATLQAQFLESLLRERQQ